MVYQVRGGCVGGGECGREGGDDVSEGAGVSVAEEVVEERRF